MSIRKLVFVAALVAVTACSPKGTETTAAANNAGTCPDASCPEVAQFYEPIKGLSLDVPYHFRSDKKYTHKTTGKDRRTVVLEFLDADVTKAAEAAQAGLAKAGYAAVGQPSSDASGVFTGKFRMANSPEIFLQVDGNPGEYPSDKNAKGTIAFSW